LSPSLDHISSLVLIAGMSGAGKSTASHCLADMGYFVLDNLPVPLFSAFLDFSCSAPDKFARTALLLDIDAEQEQGEFLALLKGLPPAAKRIELVFLDCQTDTIVRRYSETRRPHPGFNPRQDSTLQDAIQREREKLLPLQEAASLRIDTSDMTVHGLKRELKAFVDGLGCTTQRTMRVNFLSFGFKYGIPADCDLVIDVRFLPNPYFIKGLRSQSGLDPEAQSYVLSNPDASKFIEYYIQLLQFLLPKYIFEGKSYLNIGVGCTGGRHRSVAIAEALCARIDKTQHLTSVKHRDIDKERSEDQAQS
jgi:RNase adapter protein RapZ